jgi:ABC-2 type transport system permease protein
MSAVDGPAIDVPAIDGPAVAGETSGTGATAEEAVTRGREPQPVLGWIRFFRSELRIVFRRKRNLALLAVGAAFPLLMGIVLKIAAPSGGGAGDTTTQAFFSQLAGNGIFLSFIALSTLLTLVLPMIVAMVAGDSVAGEAGHGTLRYLLAVPAGRTRLLAVKYAAIVVFALCVSFLIAAVALAVGAALFPIGPVTLLSGNTVSLASGILRLVFCTLYVAAAMAQLGAIGLAISTLTEHAIGAIAAVLVVVIASEVVVSVPQLAAAGPYLPTYWWVGFDQLLRTPVDTSAVARGLLSFAVYAVLSALFAWARFTSMDVTS